MKIYLNLGCGKDIRKSTKDIKWINIDNQSPNNLKVDLEKDKLPFKSNSVDYIYSKCTLEHLSDINHIMKECHRVLKKGSILHIIVPYFRNPLTYQPLHKLAFNITAFNGFCGQDARMSYPVAFKKKECNFIGIKNKLVRYFAKKRPWIFQNIVSLFFQATHLSFKLEK